jgi:DNA repair protein RadC
MAVFVNHPCNIDLETIVDSAVWSNTDPIAALASSRLDERNKEKFQVLFVNHEVALIECRVLLVM